MLRTFIVDTLRGPEAAGSVIPASGGRTAANGENDARCATLCYMVRRRAATVGVRELRQNLSVYLDRVKKGEALTVTEHGEPVAILRPWPRQADALARLIAEGRATPPGRSHRDLPRPLSLSLDRSLTEVLDELRGDRL
jgi:prevent-host-death family protein